MIHIIWDKEILMSTNIKAVLLQNSALTCPLFTWYQYTDALNKIELGDKTSVYVSNKDYKRFAPAWENQRGFDFSRFDKHYLNHS